MNDMTPTPRHRQTPITIRSDVAAQLLKELTRDGRSQAQVIEDALKKEASARPRHSREELIAKIDAIVRPLHGLEGTTYRQLRQEYYDADGSPR